MLFSSKFSLLAVVLAASMSSALAQTTVTESASTITTVAPVSTTLADGVSTTVLATVTTTSAITTGTATASTASSTPTSSSDADFRVRVHHPKSNGGRFCRRWKADCINYRPHNKDLFFKSAYCVPGDYSGNFPHHVALVSCQFTDGNTITTINHHISAETGAHHF